MQIIIDWKPHIIALVINIILIIFISSQIISTNGYSYLNNFSFQIISSIEKNTNSLTNICYNISKYFKSLKEQDSKINSLEKRIKILEVQNQLLAKLKEENNILREQLKLKYKSEYKFIAADVIGYDFKSEFLKIIRINKGYKDGIKEKSPVVIPEGVVGLVSKIGPTVSEVLLIISSSSAIGVSIPDVKINAIAYGTGEPFLKIRFVPNSVSINEGHQIVTSGADELFPPGLPVAITTNSAKKLGFYQEFTAKPLINFYYLNNVLVLICENKNN